MNANIENTQPRVLSSQAVDSSGATIPRKAQGNGQFVIRTVPGLQQQDSHRRISPTGALPISINVSSRYQNQSTLNEMEASLRSGSLPYIHPLPMANEIVYRAEYAESPQQKSAKKIQTQGQIDFDLGSLGLRSRMQLQRLGTHSVHLS